ncbi:MAG: HlyC/CorC family transporter [Hyphomicrobiales bacterium]|nr:HlyC/CorC family transporter [Hyphomicrobiales bacterium]
MDMKSNPRPGASAPSTSDGGPVRRLAGRVKRVFRIGKPSKDGAGQSGASGEAATDAYSQERAMLRNVLALRQARVEDVMVPRADIVAVPVSVTLGELLNVFRSASHSRLPVYGETLDEPRGMVHIRDFLDYLGAKVQEPVVRKGKEGEPLGNLGSVDLTTPLEALGILRPVLYVPASMRAVALLRRMQATRTHMALVIDEYGGTDGLVSIEDLIEIVVGEIEDEHDDEEGAQVSRVDDRTLVASARAELAEVSAMLGADISRGHAAEDVDTIGGLIVTLAGRVPLRGELIAGPGGIEFEVMEADPRRLKRVRIHLHSNERRSRRQKDQSLEPAQTPAGGSAGSAPSAEPSRPDRGVGASSEPNRR